MSRKRILAAVFAMILLVTGVFTFAALRFFNNFGREFYDDIIIDAPDEKGKLIVREWSTLGGTGAEIYYKAGDSLFKKKIGYTVADDVCLPFYDGNYRITWMDNSVEIQYYSGRTFQSLEDTTTWDRKTFQLS